MARGALVAAAVLACAGSFAGAAAAVPGGIGPPDTVTPSGDTINEIYWVVFAICAFVFVAVETALVLFIFRFRRRRGTPETAEGPQIHGNTRLEIMWTLIPSLILVGIAVYVFARTPAVQATADGGEEFVVRVEAHQFYWQYEYPNGGLSFDTLYVPVDRPIRLELTAADVDHSWWVPELTGKKDALPGITNELRFTAEKEGTYDGWCAEHCGIQHSVMYTRVEVLAQADFGARMSELTQQAAADMGREEWTAACAKCHGAEGEGDIGPRIAGNSTLTQDRALTSLLFNGQNTEQFPGFMPPVGRGWSKDQIAALIEYVKSDEKLAPSPAGEAGG